MTTRDSQRLSDSSGEEGEAPESVSFGSSKKAVKGDQHALRQHHVAAKQKQKEKNRAIDRALKHRAAKTKHTGPTMKDAGKRRAENLRSDEEEDSGDGENGEGEGPTRAQLEDRMARAMRDAEEESESEGESSAFEGFAEGDEEIADVFAGGSGDGNISVEEDETGDDMDDLGEQLSDDDDDEAETEDEWVVSASEVNQDARSRNYLPDHLFKSALTTKRKIIFGERENGPGACSHSPPRKRRRPNSASKDIILGYVLACALTVLAAA